MPTIPLDLARLHRFLVEHEYGWRMDALGAFNSGHCLTCGVAWSLTSHRPDCEWVALVAMTKGEDDG